MLCYIILCLVDSTSIDSFVLVKKLMLYTSLVSLWEIVCGLVVALLFDSMMSYNVML